MDRTDSPLTCAHLRPRCPDLEDEAGEPPGIPGGLEADHIGQTSIGLAWNPVPGADKYCILRGEITAISADPTWLDSELEPGMPYTYQVRAGNAYGWSDWSAALTVTTKSDECPDVEEAQAKIEEAQVHLNIANNLLDEARVILEDLE